MKYGYARVSTNRQSNEGNSLENQKKLLLENGVEKIYEESFTGTKMDRPELEKLLKVLKDGDTLVVCKLDRIARSIAGGSALIEELINRGVTINILNLGIMDSSPASKLVRNIFLSFAEFERDMIIERTSEGREIARLKDNYIEGRPKKYTKKQLDHAISLLNDNSYKEVSSLTGISISTLTRAKRKYVEK